MAGQLAPVGDTIHPSFSDTKVGPLGDGSGSYGYRVNGLYHSTDKYANAASAVAASRKAQRVMDGTGGVAPVDSPAGTWGC